jgi:hypothetical protein
MTERVDQPETPAHGPVGDALPRHPLRPPPGRHTEPAPFGPGSGSGTDRVVTDTTSSSPDLSPGVPSDVPSEAPSPSRFSSQSPAQSPAQSPPPTGGVRMAAPPATPATPATGDRDGTPTPSGGRQPAARTGPRGRPHEPRGQGVAVADDLPQPEMPALELSIGIPAFVRRGIERRRAEWTRVDTLVAGLIGVHLLMLVVLLPQGSLYLDDLRAQGYAQGQPFWSFIVGSNGTHFAPIPRIVDWTFSRLFPLSHPPAVLLTMVVRLLLAAAFWRLLRRVFGPRPAAVIPLVVLMITPALVPTTGWFRQSITVLACTVAMVWAVDAHIRWVTRRHGGDLLAVVAATAVGLGCYEKPAAIPGILAVTSLAMFWARGRSRPRDAVRASFPPILASTAVVVVFLVIYRFGPYDQGPGTPPSPLDVGRLAWQVISGTLLPLLLGGPWTWIYTTPYEGAPNVPTAGIVASLTVVGLAVLWAGAHGIGRVVRSFAVALAWITPSVTIITYGRGGDFDLVLADAVRLWADLVPGVLFAAALMIIPWRIGVRAPATLPGPADAAADTADAEEPVTEGVVTRSRDGYLSLKLTPAVVAGGLALALVVGGSLVSTWRWYDKWRENPTDAWLSNVRSSLTSAEAFPRMLATPLPEPIMPAWVTAKFPTNAPLVLLMRPDVRFQDADGQARVLDAAGNLVPVMRAKIISQTKPAPFCVAQIPGGAEQGVRVPLAKPAPFTSGGQVEVGLLLEEQTKVNVTVETPDGTRVTPERWSNDDLPKGPHTLRFPVPFGKAVTAVHVSTSNSVVSCVTHAQVWVGLP